MFVNNVPDISTDLEPSVFQSVPSFTSPAFMSLDNVDPEEESNWVLWQLVDLMTHTQFIDECGESDDTDIVPAPHSLPNEGYGSSDLLVCLSGIYSPYPNKTVCHLPMPSYDSLTIQVMLLDIIDNLPRLCLSTSLMWLVLWMLNELGV